MAPLSSSLPHVALEIAAYTAAGRVYARASSGGPRPGSADRWLLFACTIAGAAAGAKLLHVAEHWQTLIQRNEAALWLGGKSLLGGLLGGTFGVEVAKRALGWRLPTGDPWVPALTTGIIIGRVGCQLSGIWDQTYGSPTSLPWGWNYGDGVLRHPTALYELLAVAVLFAAIRMRWRDTPGARFAAFLAGYCALRFGLEFLKPPFGELAPITLPVALYGGLSAIQWAAVGGIAWFAQLYRIRRATPSSPDHES